MLGYFLHVSLVLLPDLDDWKSWTSWFWKLTEALHFNDNWDSVGLHFNDNWDSVGVHFNGTFKF